MSILRGLRLNRVLCRETEAAKGFGNVAVTLRSRQIRFLFLPSAARQAKAGAGDEARTRDVLLGKEVLYH